MNSVSLANQLKDLNMSNLTIEQKFQAVIEEENVEKLKALIDSLDDIEFVVEIIEDPDSILATALSVGNLEILKLLLENEIVEVKTGESGFFSFELIGDQNYDAEKKIKIVEYLLPYVYTKNPYPWLPGYYSPIDFFDHLYAFCLNKEFALAEFFIEKFYAEKYNKFYPLIKRLLGTFKGSHMICIFLHQEIESFEDLVPEYKLFLFFVEIAKAFANLLIMDDGMNLAIEVFKILLEKNFLKVFESFEESHAFMRRKKYQDTKNEEKLTPLLLKRIFQFVYHILDAETEEKIFYMISGWIFICASRYGIFSKSCFSLIPFVLKSKYAEEIFEICKVNKDFVEGQEMMRKMFKYPCDQNTVVALKEICGFLIKSTIAKSVEFEPKELIQRIWKLRLPDVLKCYLLAIPDASWVNELQVN
ncbi:uncharacterized protein LOC134831429 [Culicoides brevitarsis]|uniref:uncharacterized protein LOC134831429 n=1 Tax=Culicoides brevitarsis TaxID=469753 RepID=UPI00307B5092